MLAVRLFAAQLLLCAALCAAAPSPGASANASQYAVSWPELLPEPGKNRAGGTTFLNSMPIGNGHVAANILYDSNTSALVALIAASSAWAESGELMKVALLEASIPWAEGPFSQRLDPQTATWTLSAGGRTVATAFVDANSDTLVLKTAQAVAPSLRPLRVDAASGVGAVTPSFSCQPYYVSADVSRTASAKLQTVFHRNANCSGANDYMTTTLAGENIPKDATMRDPLHLRATGAAAATSADSQTVAVAVITDDTGASTESGVLAALEKRAAAALEAAEKPAMLAAHEAWWAAKWASHYIHVTTKADENKDGARLSSMYCLQRYTQLLQARSPFPIKFVSATRSLFLSPRETKETREKDSCC